MRLRFTAKEDLNLRDLIPGKKEKKMVITRCGNGTRAIDIYFGKFSLDFLDNFKMWVINPLYFCISNDVM